MYKNQNFQKVKTVTRVTGKNHKAVESNYVKESDFSGENNFAIYTSGYHISKLTLIKLE